MLVCGLLHKLLIGLGASNTFTGVSVCLLRVAICWLVSKDDKNIHNCKNSRIKSITHSRLIVIQILIDNLNKYIYIPYKTRTSMSVKEYVMWVFIIIKFLKYFCLNIWN